jgi:SNF2 family DNA or RNA helicase
MKLTIQCSKCGKPAKIQSEFKVGSLIAYVWQCGHMEVRAKLSGNEIEQEKEDVEGNIEPKHEIPKVSKDENTPVVNLSQVSNKEIYFDLERFVNEGGRTKGVNDVTTAKLYDEFNPSYMSHDLHYKAYPYQRDGIKFAEKAELNCLFADAMGVGKTIQGVLAVWRNKASTLPCIVVVKSSCIFQWAHELTRWTNGLAVSIMPCLKRSHIVPGFNFYIVSMDMLGKKDIRALLSKVGPKSIIIDEVQNFKDPSAVRTVGLLEFIKLNNIRYKIALSGTPIKNRASEYFTILNLLAPMYFSSYDEFKKRWLKPEMKRTSSGKDVVVYQRLNPLYADDFKDLISRWVIRRERHDVLKDLPALTRDFQLIEIDDINVKNTYNRTVNLFANWLNDNKSGATSSQLLGWLAQLRAITGSAKCPNAIEWIEDFLESTDESLSIGIHHRNVRQTLKYALDSKGLNTLELSGEDNAYSKNDIVRRFTRGDSRVLILNSIAGGVGLNLQTCAQALVLERQWNSADEEQFECRFHRDGQKQAVTVTYMIAKGTIDEFFHEMVTKKRQILLETGLGNEVDLTTDMNFLQDLCDQVASHTI